MSDAKFVTVVNCMDGRTQLPVNTYLKEKYDAEYVDTVTEPGPIKYLSEDQENNLVQSMFNRIDISVNKHGSNAIAVVGHHDCAGNPIPKDKQIKQIQNSCSFLKDKYPNTDVIGIWVNENWSVEEV